MLVAKKQEINAELERREKVARAAEPGTVPATPCCPHTEWLTLATCLTLACTPLHRGRRGARRCSNRLGVVTRVAGPRAARSTPSPRPTSRRSRHADPTARATRASQPLAAPLCVTRAPARLRHRLARPSCRAGEDCILRGRLQGDQGGHRRRRRQRGHPEVHHAGGDPQELASHVSHSPPPAPIAPSARWRPPGAQRTPAHHTEEPHLRGLSSVTRVATIVRRTRESQAKIDSLVLQKMAVQARGPSSLPAQSLPPPTSPAATAAAARVDAFSSCRALLGCTGACAAAQVQRERRRAVGRLDAARRPQVRAPAAQVRAAHEGAFPHPRVPAIRSSGATDSPSRALDGPWMAVVKRGGPASDHSLRRACRSSSPSRRASSTSRSGWRVSSSTSRRWCARDV